MWQYHRFQYNLHLYPMQESSCAGKHPLVSIRLRMVLTQILTIEDSWNSSIFSTKVFFICFHLVNDIATFVLNNLSNKARRWFLV